MTTFADRLAADSDWDRVPIGDFIDWLGDAYAEVEVNLAVHQPTDADSREMYKELQAEAVALSGAAVALRLFREARLQ